MFPPQRKTRGVMGEPERLPGIARMAGFASSRHDRVELAAVDILVACLALGHPWPSESSRARRSHLVRGMAIAAWHRAMRSIEREPPLPVIFDPVPRGKKSLHRVAGFAGPAVAAEAELPPVPVRVAIRAMLEIRNPEVRRIRTAPRIDHRAAMTPGASDPGMHTLEHIPCCRMDKSGGAKTVFVVARFAGARIAPSCKLSPVGIGMTVGAALKPSHAEHLRHLPSCRALRNVALLAADGSMAAPEWEPGRCVVEFPRLSLIPSHRGVAAFARLQEFPLMGVGMARRAPPERQPDVPDRALIGGGRRVARGAGDLRVLAGQRELRPVMGKFQRGFPSVHRVAVQAA